MGHRRLSYGYVRTSTYGLILGVLLVLAFFINQNRNQTPTALLSVRGKVTDVTSAKSGLSIFLIPEGASYDAGCYYHYGSTSGAVELVRARVLEDRTKLVTLRYSPGNQSSGTRQNEVYEVRVSDSSVRTISEVLEAKHQNDILLLAMGCVLIVATQVVRRAPRSGSIK